MQQPPMPIGEALLILLALGVVGLVFLWVLWAFVTTTAVLATVKFWRLVGKMFGLPTKIAKIAVENEEPKRRPVPLLRAGAENDARP